MYTMFASNAALRSRYTSIEGCLKASMQYQEQEEEASMVQKAQQCFRGEGLYLELEVGVLPSRHLMLVHIGAGAAEI